MNYQRMYLLLHVIVPLCLGMTVYILWRSEDLYILQQPISSTKLDYKPSNLLVYTLPDFLWLYALLHSIRLIWQADKRVWFWLILCTLLSIGTEILQLQDYIPGTFDYYDIAAYLMAFLIVSIHILILQFKLRQYENTH